MNKVLPFNFNDETVSLNRSNISENFNFLLESYLKVVEKLNQFEQNSSSLDSNLKKENDLPIFYFNSNNEFSFNLNNACFKGEFKENEPYKRGDFIVFRGKIWLLLHDTFCDVWNDEEWQMIYDFSSIKKPTKVDDSDI
jgi:hypothetical protein